MQNGRTQHAPAPAQAPQRERYDVFTVVEREGARPFWRAIGSAFPNKDGKSFSVYLDAGPINGKLRIRIAERRESEAAND